MLKTALALCVMLIAVAIGAQTFGAVAGEAALTQEAFPAPPDDRTRVYIARGKEAPVPLPFEAGATPLHPNDVARSDKTSYIELKGEHAAFAIADDAPRIYMFVRDQAGVHPPFLVRLTPKRGARRVPAVAQRGLRGFAIASEEIIKPNYRVLAREGGMIFMEVRARGPLPRGEYAVIGADLMRIATFSVTPPPNI